MSGSTLTYWQPCILWKCSSLPQFKSYLTIIANSYSSRNALTISLTSSRTLGSVSSSSAESPVVSTLSSTSSAVMRNILLRWTIASQSTCCKFVHLFITWDSTLHHFRLQNIASYITKYDISNNQEYSTVTQHVVLTMNFTLHIQYVFSCSYHIHWRTLAHSSTPAIHPVTW